MKPLVPCEIAVKCVLPVIRAMIAKRLTKDYGLKQIEAARLLGVSQPAISLYSRRLRGRAIDLEKEREISSMVDDVTSTLINEKMDYKDFVIALCGICRAIRRKGLMCGLHKEFDPSIEVGKCNLCSLTLSIC